MHAVIVWLGVAIGIFGAALLAYYAAFGDTLFGMNPTSYDEDYTGSHPLYSKPLFLVLLPFIGIASVLTGSAVFVFGKLGSYKIEESCR